jgi:integrase
MPGGDTEMARPRVRQDKKTGKWIVEYYDKDKKQHRLKGFPTKRAANDRADEISGEVRKGVHTPASTSGTVADACRVWIQRARDLKLEKKTILQYQNHADLHLVPLTDSGERPAWEGRLGDLKLSKLTPPVANAVQREFVRRLSSAMSRKVMVSFKSILNEAANNAMVAYNAASTVKTQRRNRGEHKVHAGVDFPAKVELASVIGIITGRWRPLIITLAFCGLRASELRGLEWGDVLDLDTDLPQIVVRQRADMDGLIGDTKTDSAHRHIPLTPLVAGELRAWKEACPRGGETGELRFVFPNGAGNVENHANISNRGWNDWQIKAGVSVPKRDDAGKVVKGEDGQPVMKAKYGVHDLRHFFASLMIDQGFSPKRVQTLLGHASIQMTLNVYSHLFPPDQADDRDRFAKAESSVLSAAK